MGDGRGRRAGDLEAGGVRLADDAVRRGGTPTLSRALEAEGGLVTSALVAVTVDW